MAKQLKVAAGAVVVNVNGQERYIYRGGVLPYGVATKDVTRLRNNGLIREVEAPPTQAEVEAKAAADAKAAEEAAAAEAKAAADAKAAEEAAAAEAKAAADAKAAAEADAQKPAASGRGARK